MPDFLEGRETGRGSHKPAVSQLALRDVTSAGTLYKQFGIGADLLKDGADGK